VLYASYSHSWTIDFSPRGPCRRRRKRGVLVSLLATKLPRAVDSFFFEDSDQAPSPFHAAKLFLSCAEAIRHFPPFPTSSTRYVPVPPIAPDLIFTSVPLFFDRRRDNLLGNFLSLFLVSNDSLPPWTQDSNCKTSPVFLFFSGLASSHVRPLPPQALQSKPPCSMELRPLGFSKFLPFSHPPLRCPPFFSPSPPSHPKIYSAMFSPSTSKSTPNSRSPFPSIFQPPFLESGNTVLFPPFSRFDGSRLFMRGFFRRVRLPQSTKREVFVNHLCFPK